MSISIVQAARKSGGKKGGAKGSSGGSATPQTEESIKILQQMHLYDYDYSKNGKDWPLEFNTCDGSSDQAPIILVTKFKN